MRTLASRESAVSFVFTPQGFYPELPADAPAGSSDTRWRGEDVFRLLYGYALEGKPAKVSPGENFLYMVADAFFAALTALPELEVAREKAKITVDADTLDRLLVSVPFVIGSEYVTAEWIENVFARLGEIFSEEIASFDGSVERYISEKNQSLRVPERVFFHLVENKGSDEYPFAFLATYATQDENGKIAHIPLSYALTEYKNNREKLMTLLACLNKASEVSSLIAEFVENGELFRPLRLTSNEAYRFLKAIEAIESTGIMCRIPNWWRKRSSSVSMSIKLGQEQPSKLGLDAIVSMVPTLTLDGEELTQEDIEYLLSCTEGLAFLKGKWVEVDHERLRSLLAKMDENRGELTFMDTMRLELDDSAADPDSGIMITNGKWLSGLLKELRHPETIEKAAVPSTLTATLRPYQINGYTWLNSMDHFGFGACLADDMGLGKTIQVLAYLERMRASRPDARVLLVVPASLLGNWKNETHKFAPELGINILHGKTSAALSNEVTAPVFLTVTTYNMVSRIKALQDIKWDCIILDEAQAIKNPLTAQTKAVKKLSSKMRIAMTGTPIENDLTNLWSLFDFLNKGLMGTSAEFKKYCKKLTDSPEQYAHLKAMVSPFLLRRVKTDKNIIADLPDKFETVDYAGMSKKQIALYTELTESLEQSIAESKGIERRGRVLGAITKLKQICNHPDQYMGQDVYSLEDSGKLIMLKELCETIYEKRERVLVFTQFREITGPLSRFLAEIFHREGYVIHGGTPVKTRAKIVEAFQGEAYVPYLVLSLKAAGTGLNLTKASHVIHFDRWWNPAVENQATDRAFRIGQTKNVMVHKLVCQGTIEEKIDEIIESKKELAENVIGSSGENWITELSNEELMHLLKLEV